LGLRLTEGSTACESFGGLRCRPLFAKEFGFERTDRAGTELPPLLRVRFNRSFTVGVRKSKHDCSPFTLPRRRIRCDRHRVWPDRRGHFHCHNQRRQGPRDQTQHDVFIDLVAVEMTIQERTKRRNAAPKTASSRVARYSFAAQLTSCTSSSSLHSDRGSIAACWRQRQSD